MMLVGDVWDCICIFVDDFFDMGNIIICVVKFCKKEGVIKIYVFLIYGVFSGDVINCVQVLVIDKVVVINLVFQDKYKVFFGFKLDVLDILFIFVEVIWCVYYGEFISVLFNYD